MGRIGTPTSGAQVRIGLIGVCRGGVGFTGVSLTGVIFTGGRS
jgi:hypothetical protein